MDAFTLPEDKIDVVLDTDAYNEIDDQFAIAYLLRSNDKLETKAIYAAPFLNAKVESAKEGMEKSYDEILHVLGLMGESKKVYKGSTEFLPDEHTPVVSDAARDLAKRAESYSPEHPIYVIAIGAITNVASAILLNPSVAKNAVLVWLGGHALHFHNTKEFNMRQDIAGVRTVMQSGIPFVHVPAGGVVDTFRISKPELEYWLKGKSPLATYLAENTVKEAESYAKGKPWTRVIWDVVAVAYLLNDCDRFMLSRNIKAHLPAYDYTYEKEESDINIRYIYSVKRDALMEDLIEKLTKI